MMMLMLLLLMMMMLMTFDGCIGLDTAEHQMGQIELLWMRTVGYVENTSTHSILPLFGRLQRDVILTDVLPRLLLVRIVNHVDQMNFDKEERNKIGRI